MAVTLAYWHWLIGGMVLLIAELFLGSMTVLWFGLGALIIAALLFFVPGCDWTVRVNGRTSIVEKSDGRLAGIDPEVFEHDDNTKILQGILLEVDEAYAQCPRAFTFSKLWDVERIESARGANANRYWLGRWKESMNGLADDVLRETESTHG